MVPSRRRKVVASSSDDDDDDDEEFLAVAVEAPKWTLARAEPAPFRRRGVRAVADVPLEDMVLFGRC